MKKISKFSVFKWFLYIAMGILLAVDGITIVNQTGKFVAYMGIFGVLDIASRLQGSIEG